MATIAADAGTPEPTRRDIQRVIAASSFGTMFEWYDFFIYGTLAKYIGQAYFPTDNVTVQTLLTWAGFAVGFGFRPLGAILFGHALSRKRYIFPASPFSDSSLVKCNFLTTIMKKK